MSIKNRQWAMQVCGSRLPSDHHVLLVMADAASDKANACWLSVAEIMRRTGLSRRTVQRSLRRLEEESYVARSGFSAAGTISYALNKGLRGAS